MCDRVMGGIWVERQNDSVFIPLRCNDSAPHDPGECSYFDPKSGMIVYQVEPPTVAHRVNSTSNTDLQD